MKLIAGLIIFSFSSLLYIGCTQGNVKQKDPEKTAIIPNKNLPDKKDPAIPVNALTGDFNADGKLDYAWLIKPAIDDSAMDCIGDCFCLIKFSDSNIAPIRIEPCIGGDPVNLGDLNKNGSDEIGLLPDWFTSCWHDYKVFTFKNKVWSYAVDPFPTHCSQWEDAVIPIKIDPKRPGNVIISYSVMTDADLLVKTKSIPIR